MIDFAKLKTLLLKILLYLLAFFLFTLFFLFIIPSWRVFKSFLALAGIVFLSYTVVEFVFNFKRWEDGEGVKRSKKWYLSFIESGSFVWNYARTTKTLYLPFDLAVDFFTLYTRSKITLVWLVALLLSSFIAFIYVVWVFVFSFFLLNFFIDIVSNFFFSSKTLKLSNKVINEEISYSYLEILKFFFFLLPRSTAFFFSYFFFKKMLYGSKLDFKKEDFEQIIISYSLGHPKGFFYFIQDTANLITRAFTSTWAQDKKLIAYPFVFIYLLKSEISLYINFSFYDFFRIVNSKKIIIGERKILFNGLTDAQFNAIYRGLIKRLVTRTNRENVSELLNYYWAVRFNNILHLATPFISKDFHLSAVDFAVISHFTKSSQLKFISGPDNKVYYLSTKGLNFSNSINKSYTAESWVSAKILQPVTLTNVLSQMRVFNSDRLRCLYTFQYMRAALDLHNIPLQYTASDQSAHITFPWPTNRPSSPNNTDSMNPPVRDNPNLSSFAENPHRGRLTIEELHTNFVRSQNTRGVGNSEFAISSETQRMLEANVIPDIEAVIRGIVTTQELDPSLRAFSVEDVYQQFLTRVSGLTIAENIEIFLSVQSEIEGASLSDILARFDSKDDLF